jgi:hypothetical protein
MILIKKKELSFALMMKYFLDLKHDPRTEYLPFALSANKDLIVLKGA